MQQRGEGAGGYIKASHPVASLFHHARRGAVPMMRAANSPCPANLPPRICLFRVSERRSRFDFWNARNWNVRPPASLSIISSVACCSSLPPFLFLFFLFFSLSAGEMMMILHPPPRASLIDYRPFLFVPSALELEVR